MADTHAVYDFIAVNQAEKCFTVTAMCRALNVHRRSYYGWLKRTRLARPIREREEAAIVQKLRTIHAESGGTYGVNRMTVCLKVWYPKVGRRRVHNLMRRFKIRGRTPKKRWRTTHSTHRWHGIPDRVNRKFQARKPREQVVCDVTH